MASQMSSLFRLIDRAGKWEVRGDAGAVRSEKQSKWVKHAIDILLLKQISLSMERKTVERRPTSTGSSSTDIFHLAQIWTRHS